MHLSQESQAGESPMIDLAKRLGISLSLEASASFVDEINDKELIELSSMLFGESPPTGDQHACIQVRMSQLFCNQIQSHWSMKKCDVFFLCMVQALRDHWTFIPANSIQLKEIGPLLRDYQRLILRRYLYGSHSCVFPLLSLFTLS